MRGGVRHGPLGSGLGVRGQPPNQPTEPPRHFRQHLTHNSHLINHNPPPGHRPSANDNTVMKGRASPFVRNSAAIEHIPDARERLRGPGRGRALQPDAPAVAEVAQ
nr:hypothetical protein GCM10017745_74360 [Saccharothrix mutabilis subsp. capreolus]